MTTQHIGFSILSAPLAAIDRRALSQAWYSALHLAQERRAGESVASTRAVQSVERSRALRSERAASGPPTRSKIRATACEAAERKRVALAPERRAARSLLARRIEREFWQAAPPVHRATFSVAGTSARVHVTMQHEQGRLRLVAVCSPRVRAVVARALDQARFALARRGIALGLLVEES